MKRMIQWVMAAILICGVNVFMSCSKEDNPVNDQPPVIDNLVEKLSGKWICSEVDGDPMLTCDKSVITFLSATKATVSFSKGDFGETGTKRKWSDCREYEIEISGNKVLLVGSANKTITLVDEMVISSITDTEIFCCYKHTTYRNGEQLEYYENDVKMVKVTADYRKAIVGTWESDVINGDISQTWRWEFKADGTYVFSLKIGDGRWETFDDEFAEYFVDGPLFCMRWKQVDEGKGEQRDWWEISSFDESVMDCTNYTQDDNGMTYTDTFKMRKIQ
jgi:hypothetical protein